MGQSRGPLPRQHPAAFLLRCLAEGWCVGSMVGKGLPRDLGTGLPRLPTGSTCLPAVAPSSTTLGTSSCRGCLRSMTG